MRILVVEDDARIASNIHDILKQATYAADIALTGQSGLKMASDEDYDLILLDWMLPDIDGTRVCKILRSQGTTTPILILTAKTQLEDVIEGLDAGADDYLTKPFQMQELLARVRALLRRQSPASLEPLITIADLVVDTNSGSATRAGIRLSLSPKEYALLEYLARHAGHVVSRLDLLSHVWDASTDTFSNTVDVHIRYLRQKVDTGNSVPLIHTVKGKGYILTPQL
jgi:DNA-binding response OmpR family regulator